MRRKDYLKMYAKAETSLLDRPKKPRRKPLKGWTYCHAAIFADIFCDAEGRDDLPERAAVLLAHAFKELGALVDVPAPAFAHTPRAWKQTRAAYLEMQRAARSLCQAEGLEDVPHADNLHKLDRYTRAGTVAAVAEGLAFTIHVFWYEDEYAGTCSEGKAQADLPERLAALHRALDFAGGVESYGAAAVRSAEAERAERVSAAVAEALASVPTVEAILREAGAPDLDAALSAELGDEWKRFIAGEGGAV